ncbi:MAG: 50S ribosomal protein L11 methyltransferase [Xanthomonadales bacterium]|jgi:ribosomal protein L11 methyltransferase|nr:50S ribosomal protein L11 methyltransferase [Xanthomonadales bacterium]
MPWIEVSLSVNRSAVATAEGVLEALGALSLTLQDDADAPVLEPGPGATPLWPVVRVHGLFENSVDPQLIIAGLHSVLGSDGPDHIQWREVGDEDWERAWMDRFEPMRFGRRLWVVPGGMAIPPAPANIEIRLDPGLAFGTGTHPTTALCLEWLDGQSLTGMLVVDYGCGSGILAIAAVLLGAAQVIAVDNDPQALESTAANAARNSVDDRVCCQLPRDFAASDADIVLANILAGPLVELAPVLTGCTKAGGRIVLSGLLEEQVQEAAVAYRSACEIIRSVALDGWARLDLQKL